jgi:glutamate synthase domain-containing protein 2
MGICLRRHYNWDVATKTKLSFPTHPSTSGICDVCILDGICEIGLKAKTGVTTFPQPFGVAQFGAEKRLPNLEDIQILPEIFGEMRLFKNVKTATELGGFKTSLPFIVGAMGSTKVAHSRGDVLARGAARAGLIIAIGENIFSTYGQKGLKDRIQPFLDEYNKQGAMIVQGNVEDRKLGVFEKGLELGAHGIEIKLGQGAKMGLGGEIFFDCKEVEKYRKLGYTIIEKEGVCQRHSSPGSIKKNEIKEMLIKYSDFKVPIWIKIAIGNGIIEFLEFLNELKRKEKIRLEAVVVDGYGGGTGMSPWPIMNEFNLPSACILSYLKKLRFDLIVAGGYSDGIDVAKAMMMGADGVAMGRPFIIASNLINFAGLDEKQKKLPKEQGIVNFAGALKEELQMVCATQRVDDVNKLKNRRENLIALSENSATLFGLKQELKKKK